MNPPDFNALNTLKQELEAMARARGFESLGVAGVELAVDASRLERWLDVGLQGEMGYMSKHGSKRTRPDELVHGRPQVALPGLVHAFGVGVERVHRQGAVCGQRLGQAGPGTGR